MKEYRDHYFLKAKRENYPARSVYKLKEIDGRFKIFKKGMKVLDLGAAPGSWSLGAAERVMLYAAAGTEPDLTVLAGLLSADGHRFPSQCGISSGRRVSAFRGF